MVKSISLFTTARLTHCRLVTNIVVNDKSEKEKNIKALGW